MAKNKYLLLFSSLGTLALLLAAIVQENFLREWQQIQRTARSEEGPIPVQLRQIVNVRLRASDRCVSCHVSMGPTEQGVSGSEILVAHKPVVHDPAEYGCTVCHGGQGQATEKADAHGDVEFWPEPMIPARSSYAGCGTCHVPLHVPNGDLFTAALGAFQRLDCLACHRLDGRGGTIRPDGGGMEGPDLSRAGIAGYDPGWYAKHLAQSGQAAAGPWKTSFAPVNPADQNLLAVFLSTRMGAPDLVRAKAVFHSSGCLGCHKVSGVGGEDGPDLSRGGEKDPGRVDFTHVPGEPSLENWFAEHFRSPGAVVPGSRMPSFDLSKDEIELLTLYMLSLRRRELPGSFLPKDRLQVERFGEREFSPDGATIYGAFCSGCHGRDGMGRRAPGMPAFPAIATPDFLKLASDRFLIETIRRGRPGRRMPAWGESSSGLRPEEIQAVVTHLRRLGGVESQPDSKPRRWAMGNASQGERLYAAACSGCHGARGEGGDGPALNNRVLLAEASDTFLAETISQGRRGTGMEGFLEPSPVRRALAPEEIEAIVSFIRTWEETQQ